MQVQEYLRNGKTFDDLSEELGIVVNHHKTLPLTILNYHQIESPKLHQIVRECRGLVLHRYTYDVVARSFSRFFNLGETDSPFNYDNFSIHSKEDGSLVLIYHFENNWYANTRGSFADGNIDMTNLTWSDLIRKGLNVDHLNELDNYLDRKYTYVCELVSPYNKVVREYKDTHLYFLSAFEKEKEVDLNEVPKCFKLPKTYDFKSVDEIISYLEDNCKIDPTFEGVVIRDDQFRRYKIKSVTYLALHRLKNNGQLTKSSIVPYILKGDVSEMITYFPEYSEFVMGVKNTMDEEYSKMMEVWEKSKHIQIQKEFALSIVGKTRFQSLLFTARKTGQDPKDIWYDSADLIGKVLF